MKYYGKIGFSETVETSPGVYVDKVIEKTYYGDVLDYAKNFQSTNQIIDNVRISNQLSIVADDNIYTKLGQIKYAEFMGTKWKVLNVKTLPPRLQLTLGDEWNGPTTETS